jgi:hypothetical protein
MNDAAGVLLDGASGAVNNPRKDPQMARRSDIVGGVMKFGYFDVRGGWVVMMLCVVGFRNRVDRGREQGNCKLGSSLPVDWLFTTYYGYYGPSSGSVRRNEGDRQLDQIANSYLMIFSCLLSIRLDAPALKPLMRLV